MSRPLSLGVTREQKSWTAPEEGWEPPLMSGGDFWWQARGREADDDAAQTSSASRKGVRV